MTAALQVFVFLVSLLTVVSAVRNLHGSRIRLALAIVAIPFAAFAMLCAIMLPDLSLGCRRSGVQMQNSTQLRGIHQSIIIQAQSNNNWYPGLDNAGNIIDPSIESRFRILLDGGHFAGAYAIAPLESERETKTPWKSGSVDTSMYSYAMLQIPPDGARRQEWCNTANPDAPALSDRLIPHGSGFKSVHTNPKDPNATQWRGSIAWNDNHVSFEPDFNVDTQYADRKTPDDNLFTPAAANDAWMVYTGNGLNQPN